MEIITRRGPRRMELAEFHELRARYSSTLVDLGTGDGAWPRRFARDYANVLAIGVDSDRNALREAAKLAERKPARGGASNALYVAAQVEALPAELHSASDWITIYFPWAALLKAILSGDEQLADILNSIGAPRSRLSIVLNGEAAPDGFQIPTPESVNKALKSTLATAGYRITRTEWLDAAQAPATTWAGRLVKGSRRSMIALDAQR
ncbi:MAG: class I SAM-dependent methyltransferase [Chloroflexi bacterium]|nr:class I SAM-dependent methyltransferase [Chloroflexota bacterium]MYJ93502.1 class I SAM-dependent methyltransferase [Chloroflexota bacterium]